MARSLTRVAGIISILVGTACGFRITPGAGEEIDAPPGLEIDAPGLACDPGIPDVCRDPQTLVGCRNDGTTFERACVLGCLDGPAHCRAFVPSNGIPSDTLGMGTADLTTAMTGALLFDTDSGSITSPSGLLRAAGAGLDPVSGIAFRVVTQASGPSIGVFAFSSLRVAPDGGVRARGTNAFAIVAAGTIVVDGVIDLTGGDAACFGEAPNPRCAGPGAQRGASSNANAAGPGGGGGGVGGPSGFAESGGGGGGHATTGAAGGPGLAGNPTAAGSAGSVVSTPAMTPLRGGGGGGGGGDEPQFSTLGAVGGGGGGAIQLVAGTSITVGPASGPCGINAGGAGAGGSNSSSGGGGGGAGGGVLLEAPRTNVLAGCVLAANGGGGSGAHLSAVGTTGLMSTTVAAGSIEGSNGTRNAGDGGAGGAQSAPVSGEGGSDESGGGGGAAGLVHIKSLGGTMFTSAGVVSPTGSQSAITLQ